MVWGELSDAVTVTRRIDDGAAVPPGAIVAEVAGPAAAILTGERTALNFLQHLSGIATLTARFVAAVAGTGCLVLDTRKTIPGYRALAKYAVRAGGGANHRFGLYDRILLKDNHWLAADAGMAALVARARQERPELAIEIEVDGLAQLETVLPLGVDWILLDNFDPAGVAAAVARRDAVDPARRSRLEVSGNVTLESAGAFAAAGADAVSIGRLTHSAPALDLALDFPDPGGVA
jgi:nicotinate-nucleotide pyrophosphorylase (carboxylating)